MSCKKDLWYSVDIKTRDMLFGKRYDESPEAVAGDVL